MTKRTPQKMGRKNEKKPSTICALDKKTYEKNKEEKWTKNAYNYTRKKPKNNPNVNNLVPTADKISNSAIHLYKPQERQQQIGEKTRKKPS